jgi:apolipoprotein N-acyltransferase
MHDHVTPPPRTVRRRPRLRQLVPDLALGTAAALGLAPFGIWAATPLALGVLIWRLSRADSKGVFWHAFAAGLGWFGLAMCWIVEPFLVEPEIYGWMAPFALVLMAAGGALFWAVPAGLAARLVPDDWRARAIAITAVLILSDWLRGWLFTGLPWALGGHVWIGTPVGQMAAFVGATGLSALTMLMAALPTVLWRPRSSRSAGFLPGAGLAILLLAGVWAGGLSRLAAPLPPDQDVALRIVQPNAEQHLKWSPDWAQEFFRRLIDLSSRPGEPDLVIWPETAVNFLLNDAEPVLPRMAEAAGAPLLMGIQRREDGRYFNSLVTLNPDASIGPIYDKFHLVPFGEYIPWGDAMARFGISAFAAQSGHGYAAGPGPRLLQAGTAPPFQPLICYEAIFPQHLRSLDQRPGWLLQVTNDAWFGQFSGPYQHLAQARLRSIESGLPLIRAANTGISAVIDARGEIRQSLGLGVIDKIDAPLPGALPPTPWMRWGDAPMLILLVLMLGAAVILGRRRPVPT